jgi:hypothetical protein
MVSCWPRAGAILAPAVYNVPTSTPATSDVDKTYGSGRIARQVEIREVVRMPTVPKGFINACAFLCQETISGDGSIRIEPRATGFLVRVPSSHPKVKFDYFVTARHCLTEARVGGKALLIRIAMDSGVHDHVSSVDDYWEHHGADVAATMMLPTGLPHGYTSANVQNSSISLDAFVGSDYVWRGTPPGMHYMEIHLAVGTAICFPGLFTESYGDHATTLPVVRFGHIARMPSLLRMSSGGVSFEVPGYLADATSFGGFSGSPVYFLHPTTLIDEDEPRFIAGTADITGFLGLVTGHYPVQMERQNQDERISTNSGIAIITPANFVRELLEREDVVHHREGLVRRVIGPDP